LKNTFAKCLANAKDGWGCPSDTGLADEVEAKINDVALGKAKPIEAQREFSKQLDGMLAAEQEREFNLLLARG
jgi:hypothetical protein